MKADEIIEKLQILLNNGEWDNMFLATQLMKGLGYQTPHLQLLIQRIIKLYFEDFLPETDYHRIGCTLINSTTFDLIHGKINEFITVPYTEVEVNYEGLYFKNWIVCQNNITQKVETAYEELSHNLHFSVNATFQIGQLPPNALQ